MKENTIALRIHDYIDNIDIIDTHEHFSGNENDCRSQKDFFVKFTTVYQQADLITAGMPSDLYDRLLDESVPIMERWEIVEPYWNKCRFTGHMQCADIAVRETYGIPGISRETIGEIDRCVREQAGKETYQEVFRKKYHIATALLDNPDALDSDKNYYSPVTRIDQYIMPHCHKERFWGVSGLKERGKIDSLEKMTDALAAHIYDAAERGAVAFKMGLADVRPLQFEKVSLEEARKAYDRAYRRNWIDRGSTYQRHAEQISEPALESYMMHKALSILQELRLPLQIHTGMPGRNEHMIGYSNPELLSSLFLDYPNVKFDLFHIGYPYQHVLGAMANSLPNVYIDMCWSHMASPIACVRCLQEWVATVPGNKVLGFGGDSGYKEIVAGHRRMALQNIAVAMGACVQDGIISESRAKQLAKAILYDNPADLFRVEHRSTAC